MEAIVAVGAIATSSEFRRPCSATAARTRSQRAVWVGVTSQRSGCNCPPAARVSGNDGCAPCSAASAAETSSAVRYISSEMRAESSWASAPSKGSPRAKKTSCSPINPSPTGRHRGLLAAAWSLG
jgi:hypothetical protein